MNCMAYLWLIRLTRKNDVMLMMTDVMLAYFPTPHLHQFTVMKYSQPFDDQYLKLYNLLLFRLG